MRVLAVIPARYASTRFPGKPLVAIAGKPMLERVYERVAAAGFEVAIATDDERIFRAAQAFGALVWMTSSDHPSGTDRLLEVASHMPGYDAYLNVQGDEPFVLGDTLHQLVSTLQDASGASGARIGTLVRTVRDLKELQNPNAVKAVRAADGRAVYFSRQPVPYLRGAPPEAWLLRQPYWKHLGLYAFTPSALKVIGGLQPSPLEQAEGLEQLRWLEAGLPIYTGVVEDESPAIDTPEDLAYVERLIAEGKLAV